MPLGIYLITDEQVARARASSAGWYEK